METETDWCQECGAYVHGCEHRSPPGAPLGRLCSAAERVETGARAVGALARGVDAAIGDALGILGGRWRRRGRRR